nr:hypothetical protein [Salinigranum halophilum]
MPLEPVPLTDPCSRAHRERDERAERAAHPASGHEHEKRGEVGDEECRGSRDDHLARQERKEQRRLTEDEETQRQRAVQSDEFEDGRREVHGGSVSVDTRVLVT